MSQHDETRPTPSVVSSYIPELDGLRAVAIIAVMCFHLELPGSSLGWAGVYLFFVLSGFLITGILLDTKGHPHYFRNFYIRRSLRIFPIYYLTLAGMALLAWWYGRSISDVGWFAIYGQNYLLGMKSFIVEFPVSFNHTWSLAIEEQFYLLWPVAVLWLSTRSLTVLCALIVVLAPLTRLWVAAITNNPSLTFTPLVCAADSLAMGALLALYCRRGFSSSQKRVVGCVLTAAGGIATLGIVVGHGLQSYWDPTNYLTIPSFNHLLYSTLGLLFAGAILLALNMDTIWTRILRLPFLRHVGKISYGLYMYHWPVVLCLPWALKSVGLGVLRRPYFIVPLCMVVTYLAALVSWHLLEKPVNGLKRHFKYC